MRSKLSPRPGSSRPNSAVGTGRLLFRSMRAYNEQAIRQIRALGHNEVSLAHAAVLPHLSPEGITLTALATRAGMTKQSASQLVSELEAFGYLKRMPHPSDRRAQLVVFTDLGLEFRRDAGEVKKIQEAALIRLLGKEKKLLLDECLSKISEWRL